MADVQKPAEVPTETVAAPTETAAAPVAEPVPETKTEETPAAAAAPVAESSEAPKATETAAATEEPAKKEAEPIEHGQLGYKDPSFPKNLIFTKKQFWFGSEPLDYKKLSAAVKHDAHHIQSWASETGKGLLFYGETHNTANPQGVILLADASEPTTEGTQKFHFTHKSNKYSFKAANAAERDNWVSQLKAKIAEAKELAATIPESETYKKTLAALKPAPVVAAKKEEKEDKPVETADAPAATTETPAAETAAAPAAVEETKKDTVKEDSKRSSSRKRQSIFGSILNKAKPESSKKPETNGESKGVAAETPAESTETPAAATDALPAGEPVSAEAPVAVAEPSTAEAKAEDKPATTTEKAETKAAEVKDTVKDTVKPSTGKRNSVFGNFNFGRKKSSAPEGEAAPAAPAKDTPAETTTAAEPTPVADSAPVIPAVETAEPLSAEVNSPATVPVETTEIKPATNGTNGAEKKEVKSEKRKASLPFNFGGKKDESASEKPKSPSPFSKLRQTIKGKPKETPAEKVAEKTENPAEAESSKPAETAATEEAPATKTEEPAVPAAEETPAEQPIATSTPTVAATA